MENLQFETEEDKFECIECGKIMLVSKKTLKQLEESKKQTRLITCVQCSTEYLVGNNRGGGLIVTVRSRSMPELEEKEEEEMEGETDEDEIEDEDFKEEEDLEESEKEEE
ncbi:MAG: hypothetical protein ABIG30_01750 [Candidatus Aenigmatarchaeota archaeon]